MPSHRDADAADHGAGRRPRSAQIEGGPRPSTASSTPSRRRSSTRVRRFEEAFVPVLAPGWLDHFIFNEYYQTEEEFLFALADALRGGRIPLADRRPVCPTGGTC